MTIDNKEMKVEGGISHPKHPKHKLKFQCTQHIFKCDGCKERGIGSKYKCEQCNFNLHKTCAMGPQAITHPFFSKCKFKFYKSPPGNVAWVCDACNDDVLGFVYHCKQCGLDLHPCCANLPGVLQDGERSLYLCHEMLRSCDSCRGKGRGWSYRSESKNCNYHVSCVKEMLMEKLKAKPQDDTKKKPRGTAVQALKPKGKNPKPKGNNPKPEGKSSEPEGKTPKPEGKSPKPEGKKNPKPEGKKNPKPESKNPKPKGKSPKPKGTLQRHGMILWKICENIAIPAFHLILAAILGNPYGMIFASVGAMMAGGRVLLSAQASNK